MKPRDRITRSEDPSGFEDVNELELQVNVESRSLASSISREEQKKEASRPLYLARYE